MKCPGLTVMLQSYPEVLLHSCLAALERERRAAPRCKCMPSQIHVEKTVERFWIRNSVDMKRSMQTPLVVVRTS